MRNNNQQKRMRGRNNNRRSQNPLTRVYESNGPDVKVRGTAHHIAEKYQQLARDAQASGDPVAAENYLQHAEHYYRIIAAAQAQFGVQGQPFQRPDEDDDEFDMDEAASFEGGGQPFQQQPYGQREGGQRDNRDRDGNRDMGNRDREGGQREFQPRDHYRDGNNGQNRRDRQDRDNRDRDNRDRDNRDRDNRDRDNRDRAPREMREGGEQQFREGRENRWQRGEGRQQREPREEIAFRDPGQQPQPALGPDVEAEIGLPAFITQGGFGQNGVSQPSPAPTPAEVAPAPEPTPEPAVKEPAVKEPVQEAAAAEPAAPAPETAEKEARPRRRRRRVLGGRGMLGHRRGHADRVENALGFDFGQGGTPHGRRARDYICDGSLFHKTGV
jgi:hypothetical protein